MRRRHFFIGLITYFLVAGVFPVSYVKAENATLAEEHAAFAREQAARARENADRAALAAVVAEKQAVWADQKLTSARRAALERELAELKKHETAQGLVLTLGDFLFTPDQFEPT